MSHGFSKGWFNCPILLLADNIFMTRKFLSQECHHLSYLSSLFSVVFLFSFSTRMFLKNKQIKLFSLFPCCPRRHFNLINCLHQQPTFRSESKYNQIKWGHLSEQPELQAALHPNQLSSYITNGAIQQQPEVF